MHSLLHYIQPQEIKRVMLDYTTLCNAMCLRCARNIDGKYLNKVMPLENMPWETFTQFFSNKELLDNVHSIQYCGNYGDPPLHPDLIKSIDWLYSKTDTNARRRNKCKRIYPEVRMSSNGGIQSVGWWAELAQVLQKGNGFAEFGFDGLEDTNHIYRRQVKWEKCMENAKSFIDAGGRAVWQFIVFEHNEHQLKEAIDIAKEMGFQMFIIRGGYYEDVDEIEFFSDNSQMIPNDLEKRIKTTAYFEDGHYGAETKKNAEVEVEYTKLHEAEKNINSFEKLLEEKYDGDEDTFRSRAPISCQWWKNAPYNNAGVLFMFNGEVWPCCEVGGVRFGKDQVAWDNPAGNQMAYQFYQETCGKYGSQFNNILSHSLEEILNHEWFNKKLVQSWQHDFSSKDPRLELCAYHCSMAM